MDETEREAMPFFPQSRDDLPPPGLDPAGEADDGWGDPLDPGDDMKAGPLAWLRDPAPSFAPAPAEKRGTPGWGSLAGALADASAALARVDAKWDDLDGALLAGVEARVTWREAVAAAFADLPGLRREPLSLWLWKEGLGPAPGTDRRAWEEAVEDADPIRAARAFSAGLAAALRSGGAEALRPEAAQAILSSLGAFRPNVRPLYEIGEPIVIEPRPGFAEGAWSRWVDEAMRADLPALAAWADATWSWRSAMAVSAPQLVEAWLMGTHMLRDRGVLRAAPLPLWCGLDRRRQLDAAARGDAVAHAAALLGGVAAAARDYLRLLSALRDRDAVARRWLDGRRVGGLAGELWRALAAEPAISATRMAERLDATPQAVTRVLLAMRDEGLIREVSGREAWRVWAVAGI